MSNSRDTIKIKHTPSIDGLQFRLFDAESDFPRLHHVMKLSMAYEGEDYLLTLDDLKRYFKYRSNFDPSKDILLAEVGGDLIGHVQMSWDDVTDGSTVYRHIGDVHPDWLRRGLGQALLTYAEEHLRNIAANRSHHGEVVLESRSLDTAIGRNALLERAGYRPARYFHDMFCPLDSIDPMLPLPPGFEIRPATPEQYKLIWEANNEAFEDHWNHVPGTDKDFQWWQESPQFQPHLWKIAWDGDQVAGMVLNYIDEEENETYGRKRGYTEDICVRRPWRRRGLARSLLSISLHELRSLGMEEAGLGVDTKNLTGALGLYQSVGFKSDKLYINYRKPIE